MDAPKQQLTLLKKLASLGMLFDPDRRQELVELSARFPEQTSPTASAVIPSTPRSLPAQPPKSSTKSVSEKSSAPAPAPAEKAVYYKDYTTGEKKALSKEEQMAFAKALQAEQGRGPGGRKTPSQTVKHASSQASMPSGRASPTKPALTHTPPVSAAVTSTTPKPSSAAASQVVQKAAKSKPQTQAAQTQALTPKQPQNGQPTAKDAPVKTKNPQASSFQRNVTHTAGENQKPQPKPLPTMPPNATTSAAPLPQPMWVEPPAVAHQTVRNVTNDVVSELKKQVKALTKRVTELEKSKECHNLGGPDIKAPFDVIIQYPDDSKHKVQTRANMKINELLQRALLVKDMDGDFSSMKVSYMGKQLGHMRYVGEQDILDGTALVLAYDKPQSAA